LMECGSIQTVLPESGLCFLRCIFQCVSWRMYFVVVVFIVLIVVVVECKNRDSVSLDL
jgi:hypothetical protein